MGVETSLPNWRLFAYKCILLKTAVTLKKNNNINKDYILYNNKEVLFCKLSVSCVSLGN